MKETKYSADITKEMEGLDMDDLSYISFASAFAHKMLYGEEPKTDEERDHILLEAMRDWKEYKQFSHMMKLFK